MSNPIDHCLERLNLSDNTKVKLRAEEFNGKLSDLPPKIFDKGPNCKLVICIHLAYESLKTYDWNLKTAAELAGCSPSVYESVLSIVRKQLNIQPTITMNALAVALGSSTMLTHANELWDDFNISYLSKRTGVKRLNAQKELESSVWKGAIMFNCAKAFGENINKDRLHSLCSCTMAELNKSIKEVKSSCEKKLEGFKKKSDGSSRTTRKKGSSNPETNKDDKISSNSDKTTLVPTKKRKRDKVSEQESDMPTRTPISGIVTMINHINYKSTNAFAEYKSWESAMIKHLKTT